MYKTVAWTYGQITVWMNELYANENMFKSVISCLIMQFIYQKVYVREPNVVLFW